MPAPTDLEVARLLASVRRRIMRLVKRHGIDLEQPSDDVHPADERLFECPVYAEIQGAAVAGRVATGPRAGRPVTRVGRDLYAAQMTSTGPLHAHLEGFDLHAAVAVPPGDRERLEHRTIADCGLQIVDCGLFARGRLVEVCNGQESRRRTSDDQG